MDRVCEVVVGVEALYDRRFTYLGDAPVGSLIKVPLGTREVAGLVVSRRQLTDVNEASPPEELKLVSGSLYEAYVWLDESMLSLAKRLAEFYLGSLGAAIETILPVPFAVKEVSGWKKGRTGATVSVSEALVREEPAILSQQQAEAVETIRKLLIAGHSKPLLLHGITGSGKTEVYMQAIKEVIARGRQAIYLVPEISLTPQAYANLRHRFGDKVALIHSGISPGLRSRTWQAVERGEIDIVLGPRSAVFAPLQRLGLIVMDEEHEGSYRHEGGLNFHTRIAAQMRVESEKGLLVLGSATPSLEVYYSGLRKKTDIVTLNSRPGAQRLLPEVHVIDMREELRAGLSGLLSASLQARMEERLADGQQALLFLNRRGYASVSLCTSCGYVAMCPRCDVSLHLHVAGKSLKCHYCGFGQPLLRRCPACGSDKLRSRGAGTERLEEELRQLFPNSAVSRVDADTTSRKGSHGRILSAFENSPNHILLGTKMITKGLDFPLVTVVGVVDADSGLYFPDFRAMEETFQLITQVAGRAGRAELPGDVYIQTFNPTNYAVRMAGNQDYAAFFDVESRLRRKMQYPPFGAMATLHFRGSNQERVRQSAACAVELLSDHAGSTVLGPAPSFPEKVNQVYRWQITLKSANRTTLQNIYTACREAVIAGCQSGVHSYIMLD